nr:MAG TPA: hypothetical protein [Caudoviricetes sp.]
MFVNHIKIKIFHKILAYFLLKYTILVSEILHLNPKS